jgi:hypothetical protein
MYCVRHACTVLTAASVLFAAGCGSPGVKKASIGDLAAWTVAGIGNMTPAPEEKAVRVREGANSKGLTLVSPRPFGDRVVVRFKVKPEQYEGVCVVLLSAADASTGGIAIPPDHDGGMAYWSEGTVHDYMVAFHTGYHQPNMFIRRNPGMKEIILKKDVATEQRCYDVEIGRAGAHVWMKVDGQPALDAIDPAGVMPGGYIGIRLRGPGDGSYSCLFRDVSIKDR